MVIKSSNKTIMFEFNKEDEDLFKSMLMLLTRLSDEYSVGDVLMNTNLASDLLSEHYDLELNRAIADYNTERNPFVS